MGLLAFYADKSMANAEALVVRGDTHIERAKALGELIAVLTELDGLLGTSTKPLSSLAALDKDKALLLIYKGNNLLVQCGYSAALDSSGRPINPVDDPALGDLFLTQGGVYRVEDVSALSEAITQATDQAWADIRAIAQRYSSPLNFESATLARVIARLGLTMDIPGAPTGTPTEDKGLWWVNSDTNWTAFRKAYPLRREQILSSGSGAELDSLNFFQGLLDREYVGARSKNQLTLVRQEISMGLSLSDDAPTIKACLIQVRGDSEVRSQLISTESQKAAQAYTLSNALLEALKNVLDQLIRSLTATFR